jgi:hypothetical protein
MPVSLKVSILVNPKSVNRLQPLKILCGSAPVAGVSQIGSGGVCNLHKGWSFLLRDPREKIEPAQKGSWRGATR